MSTEYQRFVIDRIEGQWAVLMADDETTHEVARALLPEGSREGVVLRVPSPNPREFEWERARVDEDATEERLEKAKRLLEEMKQRDPGGDVVL